MLHIPKPTLLSLCYLLLMHSTLIAQDNEKLSPGIMYEAGDKLYTPTYGIRGEVPLGWEGALPRDTELFLLVPAHATSDIEIYTFAFEDNLASIRQRWQKPIEVSYGILAQPQGTPEEKDGMLTQNFSFSNRPDYEAVGYAKCGEFGNCVISFLVGNLKQMPKARQSQEELMRSLTFEKPNPAAARETFDWQAFLPDKHIFTYYGMRGNPNRNNLYLCPDGTFSSQLSHKGLIEDWEPYKGRQKGTYEFSPQNDGTALLTLSFSKKKLPPITLSLMMEEQKLYLNEMRAMAVINTDCK